MRRSPLLLAAIVVCALAGVFPASALAQADLSIDSSDSADPVATGAEFDYSLAVANAGPEAATAVTVEDTLPNEVDFLSATPSQGTCDLQGSKKLNCAIGALAGAGSATVTVHVRASRDGQATNVASVSGTPADPNQANNESTELTTIQDPIGTTTCAGRQVTILGTAGADTLSGTKKTDVIAGFDGDDQINGLEGRDIVCGGLGNDVINAGLDTDVVKGGAGNDRIRGADGDDALSGNAGDDNLGGGTGDDALKGGPGIDRCGGGPGADTRRGCE